MCAMALALTTIFRTLMEPLGTAYRETAAWHFRSGSGARPKHFMLPSSGDREAVQQPMCIVAG
jgi:hypothetical protein